VRPADERRGLERRIGAVEHAQRGTNARLDETNARLDQAIDVLTRLVRVVAAQNDRVSRSFARLNGRLDRLSKAIMAGRTTDLRRLAVLERRLGAAERRLS
jgi:ABC-type transporter Mla subunit MlaD